MSQPARHEIEKFADNSFTVARDRILKKWADKQQSELAQVRTTGNNGTYLPTLIKCEAKCVGKLVRAMAKAYVEAFDLYGVPVDSRSEDALQRAAEEMAAGSIAGIRGQLKLRSTRLRIPEEGAGIPWHLDIERAMHAALKEGLCKLQRQRIKATMSQTQAAPLASPCEPAAALGRNEMNPATRPLSAITADQDRRADAQKELKRALQVYHRNLSRPQEADLSSLVEIWGEYAVSLYDSLAESFMGLPVSREATFGDAGILAGGQTLDDVKNALRSIRVPRPEHWPAAETSRGPDDDPKLAQFVREFMYSDVSFGWCADDPWFWSQIRGRVKERVRQWEDSSTKPDQLQAIRDLRTSLSRISPKSPDYKAWERFCRANHKTEARFVSDAAGRALRREPFDPNGAYQFVLGLFDTAVEAQVALVKDSKSAAGCETELRMLAHGSLDYLDNMLTGLCGGQSRHEWRSKLELELLHRFGRAKERALEVAEQADAQQRVSLSEMRPAANRSESAPQNSIPACQSGQAQLSPIEQGIPTAARLSNRDHAVHQTVGEMNFRTLTNAEIMRDRNIRPRLTKDYKLKPRTDATKACLDRIRRAKSYPLSREITDKRPTQK